MFSSTTAPAVQVYDKDGVTLTISCDKQSDSGLTVTLTACNSAEADISSFMLQAAVPKVDICPDAHTDRSFCSSQRNIPLNRSQTYCCSSSPVWCLFSRDSNLNVVLDPPTECPVAHEGPEWRRSPCTRSSSSVSDGHAQQPKQGGWRLLS